MKIYFSILIGTLTLTATAQAQTLPVLPVPDPVFFETHPPITPENTNTPSQDPIIVPPPTLDLSNLDIQNLSEAELAKLNMMYAEDLISMAVVQQKWQILEDLLTIYQGMPNADEILIDYAKGAMLRKQGKQKEAINTYQSILLRRPELTYVKLDLALMLHEDKQYQKAYTLMDELVRTSEDESIKAIAHTIKTRIKKLESIHPTISLNYEATDNVNNASKEEVITWLGREWRKEASSLPQSAKGLRYGLGGSLEKNLVANHNATLELDLNGVYYWDNKPYNEQTLRLAAGYKYADIKRSWSATPFFEQNWLDNDKYNQSFGLSTKYSQALKNQNHLHLFASLAKKSYDSERIANRYDATVLSLGTNLSHPIDHNTLIYGGIDGTYDHTKDKELSSMRLGTRVGLVQSFENGVGINGYLRYARRNFEAPATFVYEFKRQDNEYQAGLSVWHNKLQYKGLRPQLNLRYQKIDSNMPAFYSRDGFNYFISIDKLF